MSLTAEHEERDGDGSKRATGSTELTTGSIGIASTLVRSGDYSKALEFLGSRVEELERLSKEITVESANLRLARAHLLANIGDYRNARVEYVTLWKYTSDLYGPGAATSLEATLGNAKCLEKLRNHAGAAFNYKRYLEFASRNTAADPTAMLDVRRHLAWNYEQAGQIRLAHEEYRTLLRSMRDFNYSAESITAVEHRAACCEYGPNSSGVPM